MYFHKLYPDHFLTSQETEEEKHQFGKLKIFFGMISGVGKTYTMLQTAHSKKLNGIRITNH